MLNRMSELEGKNFFDNIRRTVKISHFVASIIPLALLVYFSIKYVYPYVTQNDSAEVSVSIGILLLLAVAVSVLGLVLMTKSTNVSILSAQDLNKKLNSLFSRKRPLNRRPCRQSLVRVQTVYDHQSWRNN